MMCADTAVLRIHTRWSCLGGGGDGGSRIVNVYVLAETEKGVVLLVGFDAACPHTPCMFRTTTSVYY